MNVETQLHLTTLRSLITFRRSELQSDLHALHLARERLLNDVAMTEVTDRKDDAAVEQEFDISNATQAHLHRELARCEGALRRLDEQRYGDCIDCAEPIPWPRLLAQPAAERCAACQRALERGTLAPAGP
jgi:DnaK suppressor protein